MQGPFVLAIDQGTSSTKSVIFNAVGEPVARGSEPLKTFYLKGGFVEQEPQEIYANVLVSVRKCLEDFAAKGGLPADIVSCGISNQRETFVVWGESGKPIYNAIVWQCKRSTGICEKLVTEGFSDLIRSRTGLLIDPYFSGTKVCWLLENNNRVRDAIQAGQAYFGTIDTWLLFKLTGGKRYLTDHTNASRTLFFNLETLSWDEEILGALGLSGLHLPDIQASSSDFGASYFGGLFEKPLPITAMIGDSHAAAFGEGCFGPGIAKATLGTGSSILMNIGTVPKMSGQGMVTTMGYSTASHIEYALEGVIVTCGATIEWLKNNLGLFENSRETEEMAKSVSDNGGVYLVPAFSGLGAPHWDMNRKASITGLTFDHTKNHIVRAALESVAYQIRDVITAMELDADIVLEQLMIDGGLTSNGFVVQFLADLLEKPVVNPGLQEVSALGAAYLSGLQSGVYASIDHLKQLKKSNMTTLPSARSVLAQQNYLGWQEIVRSRPVLV
ncbi:FGGY family carbohydrate kinase [Dyadobacter aurulentus]|uniref:FGGY family carbohydrate kinase n=1 Tax=Dyadobacter sp. UC 10 TaxID=2605428 RepID=UPI0011F36B46|nr:glycerol kinase GlpK [Dyadobacter sp. UC 10]KAA0993564.1 glycerol kinase GlpK [Dyadobacter sp. UC 10]